MWLITAAVAILSFALGVAVSVARQSKFAVQTMAIVNEGGDMHAEYVESELRREGWGFLPLEFEARMAAMVDAGLISKRVVYDIGPMDAERSVLYSQPRYSKCRN